MPCYLASGFQRNYVHGKASPRGKRRRGRTVADYRSGPGHIPWPASPTSSSPCRNSVPHSNGANQAQYIAACGRHNLRLEPANRWFVSRRRTLKREISFNLHRQLSLLPLQERRAPVPSASAMRVPVRLFFALLATCGFAKGAIETPKNLPIEITSTGETRYENG